MFDFIEFRIFNAVWMGLYTLELFKEKKAILIEIYTLNKSSKKEDLLFSMS